MTSIIDCLDLNWYLRLTKEQIIIFIQYIKIIYFYLKNNIASDIRNNRDILCQ
jgi:hypothetical protein